MSNFPTLQPAFTIRVDIDPGLDVGSVSRGLGLSVVPMIATSIKSEPGFEPAIDAKQVGTGYDFIRVDGSGKHGRLDVRAVLKNSDGSQFALGYKGILKIDEPEAKVFSGAADMQTTPWGNLLTTVEIETGSSSLKPLETSLFVASGRFVVEQGKPVVVEYKVSKAQKGASPNASKL